MSCGCIANLVPNVGFGGESVLQLGAARFPQVRWGPIDPESFYWKCGSKPSGVVREYKDFCKRESPRHSVVVVTIANEPLYDLAVFTDKGWDIYYRTLLNQLRSERCLGILISSKN